MEFIGTVTHALKDLNILVCFLANAPNAEQWMDMNLERWKEVASQAFSVRFVTGEALNRLNAPNVEQIMPSLIETFV